METHGEIASTGKTSVSSTISLAILQQSSSGREGGAGEGNYKFLPYEVIIRKVIYMP
jgi:hypothetical protein